MKLWGCSTKFWYLAAPTYSAIMSMLELTWCVQILCTTTTSTERSHWYPWNFVEKLKDSEAILRFTMLNLGLHLLWLIASLVLMFQTETPKKWTTKFWMLTTFMVTLFSITTSVYFMVRLNDLQSIPKVRRKVAFNSYLALLLIMSGGSLFWIVNGGLMFYLGRKWMDSCIFFPKVDHSTVFYNPLSNRGSYFKDCNDKSEIQMDDVIFDARELRVNKIFSKTQENLTKAK